MGQRNGEWYSVHTNGVALREMAQRNVEWFREMARRNVAWYSVHTSLQNIRRSSWTLNCLALHKISRCCGELSSLFMAWRARNHQKYKPQIEQRSAGRHDVIESEHYRETITWCCGCSFYHSLHALVSLNMFIVLSRVMTWIKCRLSSSIFFFFWSHTYLSMRVQLQRLFEHCRIRWEVGFCVYLGRHGKKTDILNLFWHFSIKVISECFNWCARR